MTTPAGGLRDRLIHDSLWYYINGGLGALGWLSTNANFAPVTLIAEQLDWDQPIQPNTIALAPENVVDEEWELGSDFRENRWTYYCDIFAQNEALTTQISGDIRDILRGKFPALGYDKPTVNVYDYSQATPPLVTYVTIENVSKTRAPTFAHHWQRYLTVLRFEAVDYYADTNDDAVDPWWQFG